MQPKVFEILSSEPSRRSNEDIEELNTHFSSMKFFQKYVGKKQYSEIRREILKKLRIKKYVKGEEVFRHNSPSDKYYIVIGGSVAVFLPKEHRLLENEMDEYEDRQEQPEVEVSAGLRTIHGCHLAEPDLKRYSYMFEKGTNFCRYILRVVLQRGTRFGELGIANKAPRSATIVANVGLSHSQEECYLSFLDHVDASNLVLKEDRKDSEEIVNLFMESIFKGIERNYIEKMVYSFQKGKAECGENLVDYDKIPDNIYCIRSGTVKVVLSDVT